MNRMFATYDDAKKFQESSAYKLPNPYRRLKWVGGVQQVVWVVEIVLPAAAYKQQFAQTA